MMLEITDQNIDEVLSQNSVVVIDFWAEWCGPCKILGPVIKELATSNEGIAIGKVDVTTNAKAAVDYGIRGIPAIIYFKDGKEVQRSIGVQPKSSIQKVIDSLKG